MQKYLTCQNGSLFWAENQDISHLHYFWCTSTRVFTIFSSQLWLSATHLAFPRSFLRGNHVIFTASVNNGFERKGHALLTELCLAHWILLVSTFRNHFLGIWCTCGCNKDEILISYFKCFFGPYWSENLSWKLRCSLTPPPTNFQDFPSRSGISHHFIKNHSQRTISWV